MGNRDKKGRYLKGKSGNDKTKFTPDKQPSNRGRKPSRFKQILQQLESVGEPLSNEDYQKITQTLLTLNVKELQKLVQNKETPIAVLIIASAISGDIENKQMGNLDKILDRIFGKAMQPIKSDNQNVNLNQQVLIMKTYDKTVNPAD